VRPGAVAVLSAVVVAAGCGGSKHAASTSSSAPTNSTLASGYDHAADVRSRDHLAQQQTHRLAECRTIADGYAIRIAKRAV